MTETTVNGLNEIVAEEGCYLTQVATDLEPWQRIFCTKKILLSSESINDWRDATQAEKDAWEESLQPTY